MTQENEIHDPLFMTLKLTPVSEEARGDLLVSAEGLVVGVKNQLEHFLKKMGHQCKLEVLYDNLPAQSRLLPFSLNKATVDSDFCYALGLNNGTVIEFAGADFKGDKWLHLTGVTKVYWAGFEQPFSFDRGMDVRISDIVWGADAPHGS